MQKIKPGIKASDLKKKAKIINGEEVVYSDILFSPSHQQNNTPASSPPASPIIVPVDKKSKQNPRQESILTSPIVQESQPIKHLKQQVNFHAQQAQSYLVSLQATLAQLDNAKLTIKDLVRENKSLRENLSQLEKQNKIMKKTRSEKIKTPPNPSEPKLYLFTCDICQQNKKSQLHLARVNGLGIDPHKQNKICDTCLKKVDLIQAKKEEFF